MRPKCMTRSHSGLMPDPLNRGSCDPHRVYPGSQFPKENSQNVAPSPSQPTTGKVFPAKRSPKASPVKEAVLSTGPHPKVNLISASGSKESALPLLSDHGHGMRSSSPASPAVVIPAKRKSAQNLEKVSSVVGSATVVEGNFPQGSTVDQTSLMVTKAKNEEATLTTQNNLENDAQIPFNRLVAKKNDDASNHDDYGEDSNISGRNKEKYPSGITEAEPKRQKRHIQIFEHSLSVRRPRGTWKEWDDDEKVNVARWIGAHPEDITPETVAKWGMPGKELWPIFAEGAWQIPWVHIEYRRRNVRSEVGEKVTESDREDLERFAQLFGSDETRAEEAYAESAEPGTSSGLA